MRALRFIIGLILAIGVHALLNKVAPQFLAFFNPYAILIVYYAMGGHLTGTIFAAVLAGFAQDAFSISVFGTSSFALTLCGYVVAYINARLVLNGMLAFGACLAGSTLMIEIIGYLLTDFLITRPISFAIDVWLLRTVVTTLFGMLIYQGLRLVFKEEPLHAARRPLSW